MAQSDGSGTRRRGHERSLGVEARVPPGGGLESALRTLVLGIGFSLVAIALWQVAADVTLATVTAALDAEVTQWAAVVAFGCALIAAASLSRRADGRTR